MPYDRVPTKAQLWQRWRAWHLGQIRGMFSILMNMVTYNRTLTEPEYKKIRRIIYLLRLILEEWKEQNTDSKEAWLHPMEDDPNV